MNANPETTAPRQRLSMSPVMWVAIGIVAVLGVRAAMKPAGDADSVTPNFSALNFMGQDGRTPVRIDDRVLSFDQLGVRVRVPSGWTHLATAPPDRAIRPTFVHVPSGATVQLFPMQPSASQQVFPELKSDSDLDPVSESNARDRTGSVQWIKIGRTIQIDAPNGQGAISLGGNLGDPRRIGQWIGNGATGNGANGTGVLLGLIAIDGGYGQSANSPNRSAANAAIESFCDGIETTGQVDPAGENSR